MLEAAASQLPVAEIPDAVSEAPQRTPAPAQERAHVPTRPRKYVSSGANVGPEARGVADATAADEMRRLASVLRPGVQVRIERLKPGWAAGWIEDLTLDTGAVGELYEQLREEWGGASYRCTVLQANGLPAFELRISVAGPPRHEGKRIDRDAWTGERSSNPAPAPVVQQAPQQQSDISGILSVFQMIMDTNARATQVQIDAMRELSSQSAAQNQGLIESIVNARTTETRGGSLAGQLTELMEANRAIERVKRNFGAAAPASGGGEGEDDGMGGVVKEAAKQFFSNVIASEFARGGQQRPQPQQRPGQPPAQARPPSHVRQVPQPPPTPIRRPVASPPPNRPSSAQEIPEAV